MITFTCQDCGGDQWIVKGRATLEGPAPEQIECAECGNTEAL